MEKDITWPVMIALVVVIGIVGAMLSDSADQKRDRETTKIQDRLVQE